MTRLPLDQPDIVVGPVLCAADQRVVMVGRTHPVAGRADLSVEYLADHDVRRPYGLTAEVGEATCPPRTPSGRQIRFVDAASTPMWSPSRCVICHPLHVRWPD